VPLGVVIWYALGGPQDAPAKGSGSNETSTAVAGIANPAAGPGGALV